MEIQSKIQEAQDAIAEIRALAAKTIYCDVDMYSKVFFHTELINLYDKYLAQTLTLDQAKERLLSVQITLNSPSKLIEEVQKHNALVLFVRTIRLYEVIK